MSSVIISGDTSGAITVSAPAVAGTNTLTLLAATATNSVNTLGTAVATTSGTSIDFTSLPSWIKRITVMFNGVSTNGTSLMQIQIGAGSVTTSGYASNAGYVSNTSALQAAYTSGFVILNSVTAAFTHNGVITINLLGSNTWCQSGMMGVQSGGNANFFSAGSLALGGTLDRLRITTVNGTDTFDAGTINILYEG